MTQDGVRELFGPTPEFDCRFKSSQIWYYRAPGYFSGNFDDVKINRGAMVENLEDLPDVYNYVQFAFDAEGRLHAFTWIGESYTVESTSGSVRGSHFAKRSPAEF